MVPENNERKKFSILFVIRAPIVMMIACLVFGAFCR